MPKVHILRSSLETTWASCGCFSTDIVDHEHAHQATCWSCRSAHGLPKTVQVIELARRPLIPWINHRVEVYTFSRRGWESVREHGQSSRDFWRITDVRPPMCCLPNCTGPESVWTVVRGDEDTRPNGFHVVVLHHNDWYAALRCRSEVTPWLKGLMPTEDTETASEGLQSPGKTWLERLDHPVV